MDLLIIGVALAHLAQVSNRPSNESLRLAPDKFVRLELHQAPNRHRFYELEVKGAALIIRFGRIPGFGRAGWSRERGYGPNLRSWQKPARSFGKAGSWLAGPPREEAVEWSVDDRFLLGPGASCSSSTVRFVRGQSAAIA